MSSKQKICCDNLLCLIYIINIIAIMELGSVVEFLQDKTILVTGATGFLAKGMYIYSSIYLNYLINYTSILLIYRLILIIIIYAVFLEKILRVQPNVKKIYVLIRASDVQSATLRFYNEVFKFYLTLKLTM